jgi:hypothetical protein
LIISLIRFFFLSPPVTGFTLGTFSFCFVRRPYWCISSHLFRMIRMNRTVFIM